MDISPVISSFWHGSSLTFFEQLCLKSFVDHGHKVKLYSLNEITNTPPGVENADARIFLPDHLKIWRNEKRNSAYAPLSDFFRINMLRESDEIWMDCDMLCMQPIPDIPYIFAKEKRYFNNAALRLPHSSPTLQGMHDFMNGSEIVIPNDWPWKKNIDVSIGKSNEDGSFSVPLENLSQLPFYTFGPQAISYFLGKNGEVKHALPPESFYSQEPTAMRLNYFRPRFSRISLDENALGVHHIGGSSMRKKYNMDGGFPLPHPNSQVAKLCKKHDIDPSKAMPQDVLKSVDQD